MCNTLWSVNVENASMIIHWLFTVSPHSTAFLHNDSSIYHHILHFYMGWMHPWKNFISIHGKILFQFRFWAHFFAFQNIDTRLKIFPTALKKFALRADHEESRAWFLKSWTETFTIDVHFSPPYPRYTSVTPADGHGVFDSFFTCWLFRSTFFLLAALYDI